MGFCVGFCEPGCWSEIVRVFFVELIFGAFVYGLSLYMYI